MSNLDELLALGAMIAFSVTVTGLVLARVIHHAAAGRRRRSAPSPDPVTTRPLLRYTEVGAWSHTSPPRDAVVVGYDGKDHSRAALDWGAAEAARRGVPLLVLYAADYPGMAVEPGPGLFHREPGALEAAEEVTARGVTEALEGRPGLEVYGATEVTTPSQALVDASDRASAVVLGSRGHGRVAGALRGSVASAVAARASSPVVIVKTPSAGTRAKSPVRSDGALREAGGQARFALSSSL